MISKHQHVLAAHSLHLLTPTTVGWCKPMTPSPSFVLMFQHTLPTLHPVMNSQEVFNQPFTGTPTRFSPHKTKNHPNNHAKIGGLKNFVSGQGSHVRFSKGGVVPCTRVGGQMCSGCMPGPNSLALAKQLLSGEGLWDLCCLVSNFLAYEVFCASCRPWGMPEAQVPSRCLRPRCCARHGTS